MFQLVAHFPSSFFVGAKNFQRVADKIRHALSSAVVTSEQFKVFETVVERVTVLVVHGFRRKKFSTQRLLHYVSVLKNLVSGVAVSSGNAEQHVFALFTATKFRKSVPVAAKFTDPFVLALPRTQFLLDVDAPAFVSPAQSGLPTVHAFEVVPKFSFATSSFTRAIHRAIKRIVVEFFAVGGQIGLHHREWFLALTTGKTDRRTTGGRKVSLKSVLTAAFQVAVFSTLFSFAWVAVKRLLAVFALHFDGHFKVPLFDSKGSLAMSLGVIK